MNQNPSKRSAQLFNSGYFCAESVLMSIGEYLEIESDILPGIATGFCSGIARTGRLCGAISGGIMALGLVYGRRHPEEAVDRTYRDVQRLFEIVEKKFGGTNCRELIGLDLGTEKGREAFVTQNKQEQCVRMTSEITGIVLDIILEGQPL